MFKKIDKKLKLNPKQLIFCKEYLIDLNATQAATRAGYSKKTAYSMGQRLLKKVEIQKELQKGMDKRAKKVDITADRVLEEIAKMAFSNIQDFITVNDDGTACVDLSGMTREQAAAIQEVTVDQYVDKSMDEDGERVKKIKFKLADKKGNLELLGKHLQLFNDKLADVKGDLIINYGHRKGKDAGD